MSQSASARVFSQLSPSEQDMTLELLLASGSLKALARRYGVSYPTIRARLNRLIERVAGLRAERAPDPLAHKLADLVEAGQITTQAARDVLRLHREVLERAPAAQEKRA